jgi:hypothetical protein
VLFFFFVGGFEVNGGGWKEVERSKNNTTFVLLLSLPVLPLRKIHSSGILFAPSLE